MLRDGTELRRVSWTDALRRMATEFRRVADQHGPGAVGVISTGQLVTEEFYALGKLVQLGLGTSNYDGNTTLCMSTAVSGYKRSFGSDGPPGAYDDLVHADVILLIGANIAENHPILCQQLDRNRAKKLIVADPRVTKTAMMADVYLPVRPRSDLALLNGIAHILIRDGLIDRAYIDRHTTGFEALRQFVSRYDPECVSAITGLSPDLIHKVAHLYGDAKAAFIGWTMGVNHSSKGTDTVTAINNLALLTGNIGRVGGSPFSITGQCNAMGTRESGFTSSLPGYRKFDNAADREELAQLWKIPVERLPARRGLAYRAVRDGCSRYMAGRCRIVLKAESFQLHVSVALPLPARRSSDRESAESAIPNYRLADAGGSGSGRKTGIPEASRCETSGMPTVQQSAGNPDVGFSNDPAVAGRHVLFFWANSGMLKRQ